MNSVKKIIAIVLIVSMIFSSHAFVTFAENIEASENVGASTASQENVGASTMSQENVGASTASQENVGVSTASPVSASISQVAPGEEEGENENVDGTYAEEPEEADETTTTSVGASTASPEETTTEEETTIVEETITTSVGVNSENVGASSENVGASTASPSEDASIATVSESKDRIAELLEAFKTKRTSKSVADLFGGSVDFGIEAHLWAYLNINTYEMRNYPEGYDKVSDSFGQRFPIIKVFFYEHNEGDGEDVDDGKFYDFTYPSEGALNDVGGVYVVDDSDKPTYKLTGWQYLQNGQTYDLPSDISHLDQDNWWPYEWSGVSQDLDLDEWLNNELYWSHLGNMDYWTPEDDEVFMFLIPKWTPVSDDDDIYHVVIDSKKDLDFAEMTKSYPNNFYVAKKTDSECHTNLDDKYLDTASTDAGFTIDYANKTITLHANTAKADNVTGDAFTCDEYQVEDTTFGVETPISFNDFFGTRRSVKLTPIWVRSQHTITIKYFDYKENIDFNTETPVGTKELSYSHGQINFIDIRNEELLFDLYKDAEVSVWTSNPTFAYNADIDIDNPSATDGVIRYSLYKESHSDTIYMEKGKTILVDDATINLCIKRGATLVWKSKQYNNDYTKKFEDKNDDYVNIGNGRLPKFSEIPNTGIVFNFTINNYEHKNSSDTYYAATDEEAITSSEQLVVYVSGTGELPGYPVVESFSITTPPNYVDYKTGDVFNPSGLVITVTYEGVAETRSVSYDEHKSEFIFNPTLEDRIRPTDSFVAVTFGGVTVNQAITVDVSPHERAFYWWLEDLPDYSTIGNNKKLHLTSVYADGRKMISGTGPINYDGMTDDTRMREIRLVSIDDEIVPETCEEMFRDFEYLDDIESISNLNTNRAVSMKRMFKNAGNTINILNIDLRSFDTSNVLDMSEMFAEFSTKKLDLTSFDTSKVTTMASMFSENNMIESIDVSSFDTRNVKDMSLMFYNCEQLSKLDISGFDTRSVKDMNKMFYDCTSLPNFDFSKYENFDTSNVTNMHEMFSKVACEKIILTNFITSNVTDMGSMFALCGNLKEIDISSFDTSSLTNMQNMFYASGNLKELDLSNFDTSRVTNMHSLFEECTSLKTVYVSDAFVTTALEPGDHSIDLFKNCGNLIGGNGTRWNEDNTDASRAKIDRAGDPGYFTGRSRDAILRSLEIISAPGKIRYMVGDHFDPTGLALKLHYSDGVTKNVAYNELTKTRFSFNPATSSELKVSNFAVTITYENKKVNQDIFVSDQEKSIIDVMVEKNPNKVVYKEGEHVDLTGLVLRIMLNNEDIMSLSYDNPLIRIFVKYEDRALVVADKYVTVEIYGGKTNVPISVWSGSGGGSGGGGGSSPTKGPMGDLTKNPLYNGLNTVNNIPLLSTMNNPALKSMLNMYSENANMSFANIVDGKGNSGFGKWQTIPGTGAWYFMLGDDNSTSFVMNGWFSTGLNVDFSWYHFDANGLMQVGWFVDKDGKWYYLDSNQNSANYGKPLTGNHVVDGITRTFDVNGALVQ